MSGNALTVFQDQTAGTELAPEFHEMMQAGEGLNDLGEGIGGNYAILSIRGKTFRVKHQGNETPIIDEKGDAVGSLEAVIVRANPFLTKQFYEKAFEEGDSEAPVCFSIDGKTPSAAVESPQHSNCGMCPQNRFGSRITPAGVKVKACQDNKKLAIVPLNDLANTVFGGPMLFRVPASALKSLLEFNNKMTANGYPYCGVAVRIGFDLEASYPKPTFRAIRVLTPEEAAVVLEHYNSDAVERLLGDFSEIHPAEAPAQGEAVFEQDAQPAPAPQPKPAARPNPPAVKPATAPAQAAKPAAPAAKPAVKPAAPPAQPAKPAAKATVPSPPAARKPAPAAAKPAPAPAPAPVESEAAPETQEAATEGEQTMDQSIDDILASLNAVAE